MLIGRAELEFPVSRVDVLKLLRRPVVVLRPEIEKHRFSRRQRSVLGCFGLGSCRPCRANVVKRVHRREERVDMLGELLCVRAICRRHSGQGVVTIIADGLASGLCTRPISECGEYVQVLTYGIWGAL